MKTLTPFPLTPIVSAAEMQAIESRMFAGGMPVAALMEKAGLGLTAKIIDLLPKTIGQSTVSILVGPGHNGGDALVVGRELWERGYLVQLLRPLGQAKPLTNDHADYAAHLGIPTVSAADWFRTDAIIDGLFGFGLTREIDGTLANLIQQINQADVPIISLDIPSGIHSDTGAVLGRAIVANHTLCLGLWKRAFFQEQALNWIGHAHLVPFGIPEKDKTSILGPTPSFQLISQLSVQSILGKPRSSAVHKYDMGATLLICGSSEYPGAAILAAKAARVTGVGMLYVAIPQSLQHLLIAQVPDAIAIPCPETSSGAIAQLPDDVNLNKITSVAIGPGLTLGASQVLHQCLAWNVPLVIDADALNILSTLEWHPVINQRSFPTVLTPHWGELKRLFPEASSTQTGQGSDRLSLLGELSQRVQCTLVLKGAKTLIASPQAPMLINPESTSALARGGSGDVLTGMIAGLIAQHPESSLNSIVAAAVWWHAHAAICAEQTFSPSGVHPSALIEALSPYRQNFLNGKEIYET